MGCGPWGGFHRQSPQIQTTSTPASSAPAPPPVHATRPSTQSLSKYSLIPSAESRSLSTEPKCRHDPYANQCDKAGTVHSQWVQKLPPPCSLLCASVTPPPCDLLPALPPGRPSTPHIQHYSVLYLAVNSSVSRLGPKLPSLEARAWHTAGSPQKE